MEDFMRTLKDETILAREVTITSGEQSIKWILTLNAGGATAALTAMLTSYGSPIGSWLKVILISFLVGTVLGLSALIMRFSVWDQLYKFWSTALQKLEQNELEHFDDFKDRLGNLVYRGNLCIYLCATLGFFAFIFGLSYGIYFILRL